MDDNIDPLGFCYKALIARLHLPNKEDIHQKEYETSLSDEILLI